MKGLEQSGDVAMDSRSYEDAVAHYSTALSLDPLSVDLLMKRSKARAGSGSWEGSLEDADAVRVSYFTQEQSNQYDRRQLNSIHQPHLATKESTLHYLAPTATLKQSTRITICSWYLNNQLILLLGVNIFRSRMKASSEWPTCRRIA